MAQSHQQPLVEAHQYAGETSVLIACTQLGTKYSSTRARRIVEEWMALFSQPTPILDLRFTSRTPARLFECLSNQTQLLSLAVKWGDYSSLEPLKTLTALQQLELRGASAVTDISPISALKGSLKEFELEGFKRLDEPDALGELTLLETLALGGNWMAPRDAHISSIDFLRHLSSLEELLLHTIIVDNHDYSPLLDLPKLQSVRVMKSRGMRPPFEELKARLPWNG